MFYHHSHSPLHTFPMAVESDILTWGYKENDSDSLKELGSSLLYCPNFWHYWKQNGYFGYLSLFSIFSSFWTEFTSLFLQVVLLIIFKQSRHEPDKNNYYSIYRLFFFKSVVSLSCWNENEDSVYFDIYILIKSRFEIIQEWKKWCLYSTT